MFIVVTPFRTAATRAGNGLPKAERYPLTAALAAAGIIRRTAEARNSLAIQQLRIPGPRCV